MLYPTHPTAHTCCGVTTGRKGVPLSHKIITLYYVFHAKTLSVANECTTVLGAGGVILTENTTFHYNLIAHKAHTDRPPLHIQFIFLPTHNCHRMTQYRRKSNKLVKYLRFFIVARYRFTAPVWGNYNLLWTVRTVSRDVMIVLWHWLTTVSNTWCNIKGNEHTENTTRTGIE